MALQFDPRLLPQREEPDWQGNVIDPITRGFGTLVQADQYNRQQKLQELQMQILQMEQARKQREDAQNAFKTSVEYGTPAPSEAVTPIIGQNTQDQKIREMLSPTTAGQPSGLIARFREWQSQRRQPTAGPVASREFPQPEVGYNEVLPDVSMYGMTPADARTHGFTGFSSLGLKQQEAGRLFAENKRKERELALKEKMVRAGPGKPQIRQNAFTGDWEWYYPPAVPGQGGGMMPGAGVPPTGQPPVQPQGGMVPQPGGVPQRPRLPFKDQAKIDAERPKAYGSLQNTLRAYDNMIKQIEELKKDPSLEMATGASAWTSNTVGGPRRVGGKIKSLKAKVLLNVLSALKELSSTGASGFGNLSNIEGETIKNSIANLDPYQPTPDFRASLDQIVQEMQSSKEVLNNTFRDTYGMGGQGGGGTYGTPQDVKTAISAGRITREQGLQILRSQFGFQ